MSFLKARRSRESQPDVLAVGLGTHELDAAVLAVCRPRLVDKCRVVGRVDDAPRHRKLLRYCLAALDDHQLLPDQEGARTRRWRRSCRWRTRSAGRRSARRSRPRESRAAVAQSENMRARTRASRFLLRRRFRPVSASRHTGARRHSNMSGLVSHALLGPMRCGLAGSRPSSERGQRQTRPKPLQQPRTRHGGGCAGTRFATR